MGELLWNSSLERGVRKCKERTSPAETRVSGEGGAAGARAEVLLQPMGGPREAPGGACCPPAAHVTPTPHSPAPLKEKRT